MPSTHWFTCPACSVEVGASSAWQRAHQKFCALRPVTAVTVKKKALREKVRVTTLPDPGDENFLSKLRKALR